MPRVTRVEFTNGLLETEIEEIKRGEMPEIPIKVMMNVGNPQLAFDSSHYPQQGCRSCAFRVYY